MTKKPIKVLAVDDEQLLLWALERACKGRLLDINTATTSQQALVKIQQCSYDLFLLDFNLKDPSRLELLQTIDKHYPSVPIIIMTTSDPNSCELNDAIKAVRKRGAWHLLEKPFSLERMTSLIKTIFPDNDKAKTFLDSLASNYDHEKRHQPRQPHVQPVNFSFKSIVDGVSKRIFSKGILTDISENGSCLLAHEHLQPDQVIRFEDASMNLRGSVAWSVIIEEQTYRCGLRFC